MAGELSRRWRKTSRRPAQIAGQGRRAGHRIVARATTPCRRRAPRRPRGSPIAPPAACSIGSSSSAPCANSPAGRIFGSMACEAFSDEPSQKTRTGSAVRSRARRSCRKARAGANGWVASKRRSSPRAIPCPAKRWRNWSDRVAISTILSPTSSTNCARRPYELVFVAGGYQLRTKPRFRRRDPRGECWRATRRGPSRTDADRTSGRHRDRLSAAGDPRGTVAARRQGNQPRRHRPAEDVSTSSTGPCARRNPARPSPMSRRRSSWRCLGWRGCATCPTSKGLEDAGLLQRPAYETDLDGVLGLGDEHAELVDEIEGDD